MTRQLIEGRTHLDEGSRRRCVIPGKESHQQTTVWEAAAAEILHLKLQTGSERKGMNFSTL